jgi:hypothetical protein
MKGNMGGHSQSRRPAVFFDAFSTINAARALE